MINKTFNFIAPLGLILSAFTLLVSALIGLSSFNIQALGGFVIIGYFSKLQMVFLILIGLGLVLSGVAYVNQAKRQEIKKPNLILLLHSAASIVFFITSIFGLTSRFTGTKLWEEITFEEIQNTLLFNKMILTSFLVLGTLQVILAIIFIKTKMLHQHRLSKAAKILTLTSGIFLIITTMIDYPFIKEAIFFLSYTLKIPFLNNVMALVTPIIYMISQILITIILLHNQRFLAQR